MSFTHLPPAHAHRPHVSVWLVAVIGLVGALVALGAWALIGRDSQPEGLASGEVTTMLDDRIAAANGNDSEAFASFYTKDAILEEHDVQPAVVTTGREEIAARVKGLHLLGLRLASEGTPIQFGRYVAQAASVPGDPETGWILVYELGKDGKIAHQWVIGGNP